MFDGAAAVVDTQVVDDPDASDAYAPDFPAIAIPRVTTEEELTMQVLVMSQWHRQTPDLRETACGVPFHSGFHMNRRECLTERARHDRPAAPMCPLCFTSHEIKRAIEADLIERRREEAEHQQWLDDAPKRIEAIETRTRARRNTTKGDR